MSHQHHHMQPVNQINGAGQTHPALLQIAQQLQQLQEQFQHDLVLLRQKVTMHQISGHEAVEEQRRLVTAFQQQQQQIQQHYTSISHSLSMQLAQSQKYSSMNDEDEYTDDDEDFTDDDEDNEQFRQPLPPRPLQHYLSSSFPPVPTPATATPPLASGLETRMALDLYPQQHQHQHQYQHQHQPYPPQHQHQYTHTPPMAASSSATLAHAHAHMIAAHTHPATVAATMAATAGHALPPSHAHPHAGMGMGMGMGMNISPSHPMFGTNTSNSTSTDTSAGANNHPHSHTLPAPGFQNQGSGFQFNMMYSQQQQQHQPLHLQIHGDNTGGAAAGPSPQQQQPQPIPVPAAPAAAETGASGSGDGDVVPSSSSSSPSPPSQTRTLPVQPRPRAFSGKHRRNLLPEENSRCGSYCDPDSTILLSDEHEIVKKSAISRMVAKSEYGGHAQPLHLQNPSFFLTPSIYTDITPQSDISHPRPHNNNNNNAHDATQQHSDGIDVGPGPSPAAGPGTGASSLLSSIHGPQHYRDLFAFDGRAVHLDTLGRARKQRQQRMLQEQEQEQRRAAGRGGALREELLAGETEGAGAGAGAGGWWCCRRRATRFHVMEDEDSGRGAGDEDRGSGGACACACVREAVCGRVGRVYGRLSASGSQYVHSSPRLLSLYKYCKQPVVSCSTRVVSVVTAVFCVMLLLTSFFLFRGFDTQLITTSYYGPKFETGYSDKPVNTTVTDAPLLGLYVNLDGEREVPIPNTWFFSGLQGDARSVQGVEAAAGYGGLSGAEWRALALQWNADTAVTDTLMRQRNNTALSTSSASSASAPASPSLGLDPASLYGHSVATCPSLGVPVLASISNHRHLHVTTCKDLLCNRQRTVSLLFRPDIYLGTGEDGKSVAGVGADEEQLLLQQAQQRANAYINSNSNSVPLSASASASASASPRLGVTVASMPFTRIVFPGSTDIPLFIVSTASNMLLAVRCTDRKCREGASVTIISDAALYSSHTAVLAGATGLPIIGYSEVASRSPVLLFCRDLCCSTYTSLKLAGITVHLSSTIQMRTLASSLPEVIADAFENFNYYWWADEPVSVTQQQQPISQLRLTKAAFQHAQAKAQGRARAGIASDPDADASPSPSPSIQDRVRARARASTTSSASSSAPAAAPLDPHTAHAVAFSFFGLWEGSLINVDSFVSRHVNATLAQRIYAQLSREGIVDGHGVIDSAFDPDMYDYTGLFNKVLADLQGASHTHTADINQPQPPQQAPPRCLHGLTRYPYPYSVPAHDDICPDIDTNIDTNTNADVYTESSSASASASTPLASVPAPLLELMTFELRNQLHFHRGLPAYSPDGGGGGDDDDGGDGGDTSGGDGDGGDVVDALYDIPASSTTGADADADADAGAGAGAGAGVVFDDEAELRELLSGYSAPPRPVRRRSMSAREVRRHTLRYAFQQAEGEAEAEAGVGAGADGADAADSSASSTSTPILRLGRRSLIYVYCFLPTCEPGYVRVAVPWADSANITDTAVGVNAHGEPLLVVIHEAVQEIWGTKSSITVTRCRNLDCHSDDGYAIGGGDAPVTLFNPITTYTGRITVRNPYHGSMHALVLYEQWGRLRMLKCLDSGCTDFVYMMGGPKKTITCDIMPCVDFKVSNVDGMPVIVHGTQPAEIMHCSNPFCVSHMTL